MRVLFVSNLYPNPMEPHRAAFSRQQIAALSNYATIDVIAPISWIKSLNSKIPSHYTLNGVNVYHPVFWYTPLVLRGAYGMLYYASIRRIAERLLTDHKYDVIYSSWLFPDVWAAAQLSKKFNVPFVGKVVGTDVNRLSQNSSITNKSIKVAEDASAIVAVSRRLKERLVELGASADKITVVDNGVDRTIFYPMDKLEVRKKLGLANDEQRILFVGNLLQAKGLGELTHAFAKLIHKYGFINLKLDIIGAGPFASELQRIVLQERVESRVTLWGTMPQNQIALWMNACDVFCLPSYSEGQPNVVLEALSCGARTVASNVGGIPDLDRGQPTLKLVEPKSADLLVDPLKYMLNADLALTTNDFINSWDDNASQIMQIFSCVAHK